MTHMLQQVQSVPVGSGTGFLSGIRPSAYSPWIPSNRSNVENRSVGFLRGLGAFCESFFASFAELQGSKNSIETHDGGPVSPKDNNKASCILWLHSFYVKSRVDPVFLIEWEKYHSNGVTDTRNYFWQLLNKLPRGNDDFYLNGSWCGKYFINKSKMASSNTKSSLFQGTHLFHLNN